jgi:hypothetical protein
MVRLSVFFKFIFSIRTQTRNKFKIIPSTITHFFFHFFFFVSSGLENGSIVIWYPFERENRTRELTGHDQIYQLWPSPDGRFLASTDYFKKLIIWSTKVKDF